MNDTNMQGDVHFFISYTIIFVFFFFFYFINLCPWCDYFYEEHRTDSNSNLLNFTVYLGNLNLLHIFGNITFHHFGVFQLNLIIIQVSPAPKWDVNLRIAKAILPAISRNESIIF
jgi:hypothetical protein